MYRPWHPVLRAIDAHGLFPTWHRAATTITSSHRALTKSRAPPSTPFSISSSTFFSTMTEQEHPAVTRFREYLRIKTVQPDPDYASCVTFLERQASELGLPVKAVEAHPGKPNVIMTFEGLDPSLPTILLNSHTDVVPVFPEKWSCDPFEAVKRKNGDILARGAQDMKCVGSSYLEAIRNLRAKGWRPLRTIHLSFVADEEIGGNLGMKLFIKTPEFKALNVGFALDEGISSPTNNIKVFYGERAPWWIKLTATGKTGHGSQFIDNTAVEKLVRVIQKFLEYRDTQEKLLEVGVHDDGKPYALGDVTTVNVTMLGGGIQYNVIPQEATAGLDIRVTPNVNLKDFETEIKSWVAAEPGLSFEFVNYFGSNAKTATDDSNAWWVATKSVADEFGITLEPEIFPAATDSRYLREIGIPALGISFLRNTPVLLHDHDEYINENLFLEGIGFYERLIEKVSDLKAF